MSSNLKYEKAEYLLKLQLTEFAVWVILKFMSSRIPVITGSILKIAQWQPDVV